MPSEGAGTFEGDTEFEEFGDDFGEILEKFILVLGICIDPFLEDPVLRKCQLYDSWSGVPRRGHSRWATS